MILPDVSSSSQPAERERERAANLAVGSSIDNRQTFGSILGGYGSPVMITARPLLLAKSNPSLTYTEQQGKPSKVKFAIFLQSLSHLSSAHSKENGSVSFGVVDSLVESIHCLFIIKNPVITGCW